MKEPRITWCVMPIVLTGILGDAARIEARLNEYARRLKH
jgi:hypothetical protein